MATLDYSVTDSIIIEKPKKEYLRDYTTGWDLDKDCCKKIAYSLYNDFTKGIYLSNDMYRGIDTSTCSDIWRKYDTTTTAATYDNGIIWNSGDSTTWSLPVVAPGDRIRQMIRDRMGPAIRRSRTSLSIAMDVREERARQTLRRIIGEQAFRKFIRDGFITVVPKSGLTYRIYPGQGMTDVYDKGIMVDRLCVVLKGDFPPTDSILMRYLLILNDEGEFSEYAIKQTVRQGTSTRLVLPVAPAPAPALTEAWAKLKVA